MFQPSIAAFLNGLRDLIFRRSNLTAHHAGFSFVISSKRHNPQISFSTLYQNRFSLMSSHKYTGGVAFEKSMP
jgi:hypothetical protein